MKNFDATNFNKIRRFLLNQAEFGSNCAVDKHIKILVKVCKSADLSVKYFFSTGTIDTF